MEIKYSRNEIKKACNILKNVLGIEYATRDINTKDGVIEAMENIVHKYIIQCSKNGKQIEDRITELENEKNKVLHDYHLMYTELCNVAEKNLHLTSEIQILRTKLNTKKSIFSRIFG